MKCEDCGKKINSNSTVEDAYSWLKELNDKHPPFDVSKWVPLSVRYRHIPLKTLWKMDLEDILKLPTADEIEKEKESNE